jgi:hypothetical protein
VFRAPVAAVFLTRGSDVSFCTAYFAKAARTMDGVDLWHARPAMKTLSKERREAIAAAAEK